MLKKIFVLALLPAMLTAANASVAVVDFEDVSLDAGGYWNGSDLSGEFTSSNVSFGNEYVDWGGGFTSWSGFACSNNGDTATAGFGNQYSSITGGGNAGSSQFGIGGNGGQMKLELPYETTIYGGYFTNTTYAYLSMRDGDMFAKQFGGSDGTEEDWFMLTVKGFDTAGTQTGLLTFYLADFTSPISGMDFISDKWEWFNFMPLGDVKSLVFELSSSDTSDWGMNTPGYFAVDDLMYETPEPATMLLLGLGGAFVLRARRR